MTVGELKKELDKYPDYYELTIPRSRCDFDGPWRKPVTSIVHTERGQSFELYLT